MKKLLPLVAALLLIGLLAPPATAAESFVVTCHVCSDFEVFGKGLKADATYSLVVTDVRTGQQVTPGRVDVKTDGVGNFSYNYPLDLAAHPSLQGSLYDSNGNDMLLAAHSTFTAPLKCGRKVALPYTGPTQMTPILGLFGFALVGMGGLLLLAARRRRA